jgi:FtsH-binding integral membrane protein
MMHFQNPVPINLHQNIPHFSSFSPPLPSFLMFVEMVTIMYANRKMQTKREQRVVVVMVAVVVQEEAESTVVQCAAHAF